MPNRRQRGNAHGSLSRFNKNFQNMHSNVNNNRLAQRIFYRNRAGINRVPTNYNNMQGKQSVHQRLGKKMNPTNNTNAVKKYKPAPQRRGGRVFKQSANSAQNRIKLIRQKQNIERVKPSVLKANNVNEAGKHRLLNRAVNKPINYVVEVKNNNRVEEQVQKHHNTLNSVIQNYIKQIQKNSINKEIWQDFYVPVVTTNIKLGDRFAQY